MSQPHRIRPIRFIKDEYVRAYRGLPRRAWILFAVNLVNSSGSMVIFFLALYLTRKLGLTTARAGQALSLYGVGSLAGAFAGGWLSDHVGSITVQKVSLAVCGVTLIVLGQVRTVAGILPLLFGLALFAGMLYPANATSMSKICPAELQVKGFALNRLANNLGATIGPAVGGVLALSDYRLLFWADGLTSLAAAAVFAVLWKGARAGRETRSREPKCAGAAQAVGAEQGRVDTTETERRPASGPAIGGRPRPSSPWRDVPFLLLMLIWLVWCSVFVQLLTTFPIYMRNVYGLAENRIGQLFAVNTIMIVTLEMILMERIRKHAQARAINISIVLLGDRIRDDAAGAGVRVRRDHGGDMDIRRDAEHAARDRPDRGARRRLEPRPVYGTAQLLVLAGVHHRSGGRHRDLRAVGP